MSAVEQVIAWLAQQDTAIYLVGGSVRDPLLGRQLYDLDLAVSGDGLALARRLANHFDGAYYPLDEERGTGRTILPDPQGQRLIVDVAGFRGTGSLTPTLTTDLADRDFTINALASDVRTPHVVIDRHGGLADLDVRLIRPISQAIIRDDPLRALRAIRQAAELGFSLAPETEDLIRRDGAALAQVSRERIRDELARLLVRPLVAASLHRLDDLGILTIILPELEPLRGLAQPPPHYLPVLDHSLETVRALELVIQGITNPESPISNSEYPTPNIAPLLPFASQLEAHLGRIMSDARPRLVTLKLAALLHDLGKPSAQTIEEEGRIRFIGHDREGARLTAGALRRLRFSKDELRLGETIVRHHMRPLLLANQKSVSSRAVYRFFRDTREAGVDVLLHALADHRAIYGPEANGESWPDLVDLVARMLADYWQRSAERVAPPPLLDGRDLLREFELQPGPRIGELLEAVREAQVTGEISTREEALAFVRHQVAGT